MIVANPQPNIQIIDSRDDKSITYLVIDGCKVKLKIDKLGDFCYVLKEIKQICGIDLTEGDCK